MNKRLVNASTRFGCVGEPGSTAPPPAGAAALQALYACAREAMLSEGWGGAPSAHPYRASQRSVGLGFRLFFSRNTGRIDVWREMTPRATVVVGRHTACDVHLPHADTLSLRHLLISCVLLDDGSTALRVIDLKTTSGFTLLDGTARTSVVVTGPVGFGLADYAVVALPLGVDPTQLPPSIPQPTLVNATEPPRRTMVSRFQGHITLLPGLSEITQRSATPGPGAGGSAHVAPGQVGHRLTLRRYDYGATVELTAQELGTGVLVGRSQKCSETLRRALTEGVSRTHLLLIREEGQIVAHDLCSVQRTYVHHNPVRRVVLDPRGMSVWMASGMNAVELFWHPQIM